MFTGIIVGTGKVTKLDQKTKNRSAIQMTVNLGKYAKGLKIGQSVAINGVCLSATKISNNNCVFEMIDETTKKTDLGNVKAGSIVNVERSLKVGDRLEGHFVLGHIDGVATITKIEKKPKEVKIWFRIPKKLTKYVVKKGSIALDGISLTLVDVKKDVASVCLIPHTINVTNFKSKKIGDKLNIETDVLGKYVLK
uniref:Riboflavin synthase n=5 Tax=environmental samples TaxID=651140 RepID=A0A075GJI5_9ARCH|nr:riboflavin synthase subunit alpha (ribE, RIB5) [uncultured marine thaumarchaeote KM3_107_D09]AIF02562.1 riboflavin synthase subunit alpha (ribE, RIB5) [uncultured marine thaumarchaeote KM3_157_H08]AIF04186.1 riboflavin synthase subunit alpha (ribE, RIB5) [uncultured marine thaumarchaeote KM3_172_D05]AIF10733.1 riboflavin synthase subunit alpha (ribE, RIB5) [uncultured marine thaumarchaeote KM3_47_A03]AIF10781.1 riboflavin synthase subunit alpha (ribE, RIB5) [uncultured marine thaumarchaeote 